LSAPTIAAISDETNSLWFSVASACELTIKVSRGTLSLPEPIDSYLASRMKKLRAQFLDIRADQVLKIATLPLDRFDLILLAQARVEGMTLVTANPDLVDRDVEILLNDSDECSRISVRQKSKMLTFIDLKNNIVIIPIATTVEILDSKFIVTRF
jgi:PIN domain nuclease of toxin-antitoxin system